MMREEQPKNEQPKNEQSKSNFSFSLNISTLNGVVIILLAHFSDAIPMALKGWIYLLGFIVILSSPVYQYLLWRGVKKEERLLVSDQLSPLMRAAWDGDLAQLQNILATNTPIDHRDERGATALMYASVANQPLIVGYLLKNGAKKGLQTHKGNTAMFFAVQEKHNEIITLLSS